MSVKTDKNIEDIEGELKELDIIFLRKHYEISTLFKEIRSLLDDL